MIILSQSLRLILNKRSQLPALVKETLIEVRNSLCVRKSIG